MTLNIRVQETPGEPVGSPATFAIAVDGGGQPGLAAHADAGFRWVDEDRGPAYAALTLPGRTLSEARRELAEYFSELDGRVERLSTRYLRSWRTLARAGLPVSPAVAALLWVAGPDPSSDLPTVGEALAAHLRIAGFGADSVELVEAADAIDGGTGAALHHGCPDPAISTSRCRECWIAVTAELDGGFYEDHLTLA